MKLQKASKDNDDDDNRATSSQTGRLRTRVGSSRRGRGVLAESRPAATCTTTPADKDIYSKTLPAQNRKQHWQRHQGERVAIQELAQML